MAVTVGTFRAQWATTTTSEFFLHLPHTMGHHHRLMDSNSIMRKLDLAYHTILDLPLHLVLNLHSHASGTIHDYGSIGQKRRQHLFMEPCCTTRLLRHGTAILQWTLTRNPTAFP